MHIAYTENTSPWETRKMLEIWRSHISDYNVPWDDTVSTGIYVPTFRGQPLLPSSGCKNVHESGGSRFMCNTDICLPNNRCHILGRIFKKHLVLLCASVHFPTHAGKSVYSILSCSFIERVRLSKLLSVCLSHPVDSRALVPYCFAWRRNALTSALATPDCSPLAQDNT